MLPSLAIGVFSAVLIFAALYDALTMTIPNRLTAALAGLFFIAAPLSGMPFEMLAAHVGAGALLLFAGMALYARGWLGGGDAKLLAGAALWLGWGVLLPFLLYSAIFGGLLAVIIMVFRRVPIPAGVAAMPWLSRLHDAGEGIPYGIAIAAGGLAAIQQSIWFALAAA